MNKSIINVSFRHSAGPIFFTLLSSKNTILCKIIKLTSHTQKSVLQKVSFLNIEKYFRKTFLVPTLEACPTDSQASGNTLGAS